MTNGWLMQSPGVLTPRWHPANGRISQGRSTKMLSSRSWLTWTDLAPSASRLVWVVLRGGPGLRPRFAAIFGPSFSPPSQRRGCPQKNLNSVNAAQAQSSRCARNSYGNKRRERNC